MERFIGNPLEHYSYSLGPGSLCKILSSSEDTLSTRVFTTLASDNVYNISVVQQCRMLEVQLGTNVVEQCLHDPDNALSTLRLRKNMLLKQDFNKLLLSALNSPSAHVIASIASQTSWRKLWDLALDRGVKGTYAVQCVLQELSRPLSGNRHCRVYKEQISIDHNFIKHLNDYHPELLCHLSVDDIISGVCSIDSSLIFSLGLQLCRINSNFH